jgi:large subunit ribosomal protein L3
MVNSLLGRKLGMTRIFTDDGRWVDVTLLEAGPCTVVQRKTEKTDGYEAIQVGFGSAGKKRSSIKPLAGHFKKANVEPTSVLREFRIDGASELKAGDKISNEIFKAGDRIDISGTTKGKGFAGVIKRHGFAGGPGGHGSHFHRAPGSIGQSADPAKVYKNKRMPGRMGNVKRTTQNIEVIQVDSDKNLVVVRGSVPGANGGLVVLQHSVKGSK